MSSGERVATVATLITAGLGLSLLLNPPLVWAFVVVLVITVCLGTAQVLRSHPRLSTPEAGLTALVIPSLLTLGAALFLRLPAFAPGLPSTIAFSHAGRLPPTALNS